MAASPLVDKQFYTTNGFGFLHSQQQAFFRAYLQCGGDLVKTVQCMRPHFSTEEELALAAVAYGGPDTWHVDFPRIPDLKAMLVDHVNGLLCVIMPQRVPYLLGRDAATSTVLMAWAFCLTYSGFEESMLAVCCMCVACDLEVSGPELAAKTAESALRLPALVRSHEVAIRAFSGAYKKMMAVRNEYVACAARLYAAVKAADPVSDYLDLSVMRWDDLMSHGNSARVMEVFEAAHVHDPEMYTEIKERGVDVLNWMKTARACSTSAQAIKDEAATVDHHLLLRVLIAAVDNLPADELRPWINLYDAVSEGASVQVAIDVHAALGCETLVERRQMAWRLEVDDTDIEHLLTRLHREHVARALVVEELCTSDDGIGESQKNKSKKKKKSKCGKRRVTTKTEPHEDCEAVEAAAAAIAAAVDFVGGDETDECDDGECVVCMERPAALRNPACGHTAMCEQCAADWLSRSCECPMCRTPFVSVYAAC